MSDKEALEKYSLEELLGELKRREDRPVGEKGAKAIPASISIPGEKDAKAAGPKAVEAEVDDILAFLDDDDVVVEVRSRQRVIYGVDDRKDLFKGKGLPPPEGKDRRDRMLAGPLRRLH